MSASPGLVDIMIVDDDALLRGSLRSLLEGEGFRCAEAADGPSAVALARRAPPRCAILDLAMPGMDGFTVARQLRADPRTRAVHIHCLTGLVDASARERAREVGFEAYLTKPVDASALLKVVGEQARREEVLAASGLSLEDARNLLDAWENAGCRDLQASYAEGEGFAVRCVRPPAGTSPAN